MAFENERELFKHELPTLLADPEKVGKYALLHDARIDSFWDTIQAALAAGYERFGANAFFVQHVVEKEQPVRVSRKATPWE